MLKTVKKSLKDTDKVLLILTTVLFVFGLLNIVTASSQVAVLRYKLSLYNYFYKQLAVLLIGFGASLVIICKPTKTYRFWGTLFFGIITILAIAVCFKGNTWSGNKNWINIFGFTFQPSEFSKPAMIIALSLLFEVFNFKLKQNNKDHYTMIGIILFVGCFFPVIILTQHDLGTAILVGIIFIVLFFLSPISRLEKFRTTIAVSILGLIGIIITLLVAGNLFSSSQSSRFDFFNPCSKYESGGYQICNGFIAINSGGLLGVGIGNSTQKSYIPEAHTDSVFAIIAEEYGFVICVIILAIYLVILYRILDISYKAETLRGKYISLGIAIYIFLHILINLGGLLGIMPLTGVPLPFLSYGGSFTLALVISLAVVQRIHIENKNKKIKI